MSNQVQLSQELQSLISTYRGRGYNDLCLEEKEQFDRIAVIKKQISNS